MKKLLDLPSGGYGIRTGGLLSKTVEIYGDDFSGVYEVLWTDMIAGTFVLDFLDYTVTAGNFRMVLINGEEIIAIIEPGTTHVELEDVKGDFSLRIAGESAAFSFSMTQLDYDTFSHP